jgi:hypothetical protein
VVDRRRLHLVLRDRQEPVRLWLEDASPLLLSVLALSLLCVLARKLELLLELGDTARATHVLRRAHELIERRSGCGCSLDCRGEVAVDEVVATDEIRVQPIAREADLAPGGHDVEGVAPREPHARQAELIGAAEDGEELPQGDRRLRAVAGVVCDLVCAERLLVVVVELFVVLVECLRQVEGQRCVSTRICAGEVLKVRTWRNCEVFGSSVKMRMPYSDSA